MLLARARMFTRTRTYVRKGPKLCINYGTGEFGVGFVSSVTRTDMASVGTYGMPSRKFWLRHFYAIMKFNVFKQVKSSLLLP